MNHPDLERAIAADPENPAPYLAYASWLRQQGHPRGELIELQHALLVARGADAKRLEAREAELLAQHREVFLGPLAAHVKTHDYDQTQAFAWRLGFIEAARLSYDYYADQEMIDLGAVLRLLVAHPSGRFLQRLSVGLNRYDPETLTRVRVLGQGRPGQPCVYYTVVEALVATPPTALRHLFIGDFPLFDQMEISWTAMGGLGDLWRVLPRLHTLILQGGEFTLGDIELAELRHAEFRTGGLSLESLRSICSARWPSLERLMIWFGAKEWGAQGGADDIATLLDGQGLGKLKHLGLMNAEFSDELCRRLPQSKILQQLSSLDLSMGTMSDEGAAGLAAAAGAFQHLDSLNLEGNFLSPEGERQVKGLCAHVRTGGQRESARLEDGWHERYVSVGE